ncbi:MAG: DUF697 domain-containing protein [Alphaproteobacteria bacterium]|nr:DUF697 domain-containing protein [Alphaproteobacteria bacterium]
MSDERAGPAGDDAARNESAGLKPWTQTRARAPRADPSADLSTAPSSGLSKAASPPTSLSTSLPASKLPQDASVDDGERWEIARQWRAAWRAVKWGAGGVAGLIALSLAGQIFLFYDMFRSVHPWLGAAFVVIAIGALARFLAWPLFRFLSGPKALRPPNVDLGAADLSTAAVRQRHAYVDRYLARLAVNPETESAYDLIVAARSTLAGMTPRFDVEPAPVLAQELASFERTRVAPLLKDLDARVDAYVRKEAVAVGVATSISLNGTIDAFLVLWRNVNMVARVARMYHGRPDLRVSLMILRDVALAVILSRVLEDVSEMAGEALGGVVGKLGGVVIGPFLDGSLNALMTLKLGDLAKRRCRSFEPWSEKTARSATRAAFDKVSRESGDLVGEIFRASGAGVGKVAEAAATATDFAAEMLKAAPRSAWGLVQGVVARVTPANQR